jgi:capsular exopolysaccharide synthesis family protein
MDPLKVPSPQESKLHFLDYWRIIRIRKTVILAVFLLVVITATLVTFILPESFSSTARIKVERDQTDIGGFSSQNFAMAYDPYFIQTEFEVIQSELILGKVVETLDLNRQWGRKYAGGETLKTAESISLLKRNMDLRPVRNTSLIEIRVFSENKQEAADIANAVAKAYQQHRLDQKLDMLKAGIRKLEERFSEQEAKVKEARDTVEKLRTDLKISDIVASENAPAPMLTLDELRRLNELKMEAANEYTRQNTMLQRLKALSPDDQAHAIPTAIQDPILGSFLEQRALAEQRLLIITKDYGETHPEYIKAKSQVEDLRTKVNERVRGVILGLESKVASVKAAWDDMKLQVEEAQRVDIEKTTASRPYWEAKRRLDELQRFRQLLDMKIVADKIDEQLPRTAMVQIVDKATPGLRPVRPNKPLNIALGIIIGLVVGVGLAFFIEYLDTSVKTIDDVERALQAPVLGVIPQNVGLMIEEGIESPHAEAYRVLRTNLLFSRKDDKLNTVAVVSAGAGEGKSTTVFNLAAIFAQSGQRVLVVDSDLRRPTLHKMLKITNSLGLTNYLLKQNTLEEVIQTTNIPTLDFLASGKLPSSSLGILSSAQMRDLISELKQRYDFVFFDSPPIMGVSDASILASSVDMTLQVIQYRRYPQPMNIRAKQLIEKVGGNLVGIVLNNINMSQDESYYYYSGYYHDYYYSHKDDSSDAARTKTGTGDQAKAEIKPKY